MSSGNPFSVAAASKAAIASRRKAKPGSEELAALCQHLQLENKQLKQKLAELRNVSRAPLANRHTTRPNQPGASLSGWWGDHEGCEGANSPSGAGSCGASSTPATRNTHTAGAIRGGDV